MAALTLGQAAIAFPAQSYSGQQSPVIFTVPDAATSITAGSIRSAWPTTASGGGAVSKDVISVLVEISTDGGISWNNFLNFNAPGGLLTKPIGGTALTTSYAKCFLPSITNRQIRVSMNCFIAINTQLNITVS